MKKELDIQVIREKLGAPKDHVMDGKRVAQLVRENVKQHIDFLKENGVDPVLAVVLVGDDPASKTYVKWKVRACKEVGIRSVKKVLPAQISQEELNDYLDELNENREVDGILLQLPLPKHLDTTESINRISPAKDVDGFHHVNLGELMARESYLEACTPRGIMMLFDAYNVALRGKDVCVLGRSVMVGRPMAQMLVRADATVTMCHRHTAHLEEIVKRSDVVVSATGVPELVKGEWIKEGAVVVDVGQSHINGKIVGDVEYSTAVTRASLITPVPGGVGPMTVAALMANAALAAWKRYEESR